MRVKIGEKAYKVRRPGRFCAFVLLAIVLSLLAGYCLSGAALADIKNRLPQETGAPVRTLGWLAIELTGNR